MAENIFFSARNRFLGVNYPRETDKCFSTTAVFSVVIPMRTLHISIFLFKSDGHPVPINTTAAT
jgi:hypothetical protein